MPCVHSTRSASAHGALPRRIDAGDLQAALHGQRELWRDLLYSAAGGFDLPRSYLLDWAVAIYTDHAGGAAPRRLCRHGGGQGKERGAACRASALRRV